MNQVVKQSDTNRARSTLTRAILHWNTNTCCSLRNTTTGPSAFADGPVEHRTAVIANPKGLAYSLAADLGDVLSGWTLLTLHDVEFDTLAFRKRAETAALNG